jgi:GNAT superfamily N-acetyltransferase
MIGEFELVSARVEDAAAIAALQTESWRDAYRGFLPDEFLAGPIEDNRNQLWQARLTSPGDDRRLVLKAVAGNEPVGFVCVLLDADPAWGPLLDNLHVRPAMKGLGIGWQLFQAARDWVIARAPLQPMHLWVIEGNAAARRFYDRQGGAIVERRIVEVTAGIMVPALRYVWAFPPPDIALHPS